MFRLFRRSLLLFALLALTACQAAPPPATDEPPSPAVAATPFRTPTPFRPSATPSSTPEPLAARVNGEPIPLAALQAEADRWMQHAGLDEAEATRRALDDLIAQTLLAQAARQAGFQPGVDERLAALIEAAGGQDAFHRWLDTYGYTETTFHTALARSLAAAWMRDRILESVPQTAEQVHARYIFVYNETEATRLWQQVQAGKDFGDLAASLDPWLQGDAGWFPRGCLLQPQVDEAAFGLQPGEVSPPIAADDGFYLVQVLDREANHPLSPLMHRCLQAQALQTWLDARRAQAQIDIIISLPTSP